MLARPAARYVCQACGSVYPKWAGRCDACGAWNQIVEEPDERVGPRPATGAARRLALVDLSGKSADAPRQAVGMTEFDRVCGGGLVPGSALLVGGDPGIGKSTLLLQVLCRLAQGGGQACLYVSGEEAVEQVRLRAARLGLAEAPVLLASATNVHDIAAALDSHDGPRFAVIDSIQTAYVDGLESAPGTVAQVRAAAAELIRVAKKRGVGLFLVGHVTKEGMIAGPRVLEHMVDTVLYFEGERSHQFRILRAVKNRFGATDEIGVFEMTDAGLREVGNPSQLFLANRHGAVSGAAVFAGMEGTRPVLVEVQALVAPSPLGTPRRAVVGWDTGRLAMVLAVLEARCGVRVGANDVYLNIAGGLRIGEPAADLAVAAALLSSLNDTPVPADTVVFGEIGLTGEVRSVSHTEVRLKEARKLGFPGAILPRRTGGADGRAQGSLPTRLNRGPEVRDIARLDELVPLFGNTAGGRGNRG